METNNGYFLVIPQNDKVLFAAWKIDVINLEKISSAAVQKGSNNIDFIIAIYSIEKEKHINIDEIPVYGLENKWHIFIKNFYQGKKIFLQLAYINKSGRAIGILQSKKIDIPHLSHDALSDFNKNKKRLYFLSGIDLGNTPTSNIDAW